MLVAVRDVGDRPASSTNTRPIPNHGLFESLHCTYRNPRNGSCIEYLGGHAGHVVCHCMTEYAGRAEKQEDQTGKLATEASAPHDDDATQSAPLPRLLTDRPQVLSSGTRCR